MTWCATDLTELCTPFCTRAAEGSVEIYWKHKDTLNMCIYINLDCNILQLDTQIKFERSLLKTAYHTGLENTFCEEKFSIHKLYIF